MRCSWSRLCGDLFQISSSLMIIHQIRSRGRLYSPSSPPPPPRQRCCSILHLGFILYSVLGGNLYEGNRKWCVCVCVCGLFSPLESSYLGPSVGGELRCVKWEEEKAFYWLINQICGVWGGGEGEHCCCYTNRGQWWGWDTKKGSFDGVTLRFMTFHKNNHILTSFPASEMARPPPCLRTQITHF